MGEDEHRRMQRSALPASEVPWLQQPTAKESTVDLGTLLEILGRKIGLIALVAGVVACLAATYAFLTPPVYESSASILIDPRQKKTVDTEVVPSGLGTSIGENLALVDSQVKVIQSDAVLRPVVKQLNLATDPEFGARPPTILQRVMSLFSFSKSSGVAQSAEDRALRILHTHLNVARQEQTYVIDVTATSDRATMAARIAQATAMSYLADQSTDKIETTERVSALMDGQLEALRVRLRSAETAVQEFRAENDLQEAEGELITAQQMLDLNEKLAQAKAKLAETAAKATQIELLRQNGVNLDTIGDVIESQTISRLREQYASSSRREAIYNTTLLPSHPAMQQIRSEVARLESLIRAEVDRIWKSATLNHKIAEKELAETEAAIVASRDSININDSARIKLRELTREAETTRAVYESFLARVKEMNEAQQIYTPDARIISPAATPIDPVWPKKKLIVALGLVFGLGLGGSLAVATEHLNRQIRNVDDLDAATGLKTLLAVPAVRGGRRRPGLWPRSDRAASYDDLLLEVEGAGGRSKFGRAVRRLLSYLTEFDAGTQSRVVLLTSPERGAGKTALALSLAFASAEYGIRTLIIDANEADPSLTRIFDGQVDASRVSDRIIADGQLGLSFLSLATEDSVPRDWAGRNKAIDEIERLTEEYDLTLIDAGVLPLEPNASALVAASQAIVFVARASTSIRQTVAAAASELLRISKGRRCAAVLTMADPKLCN